jgi:hypothetical protein
MPDWVIQNHEHGNLDNSILPRTSPVGPTSGCHQAMLASTSLRVTKGSSCVERFESGNLHTDMNQVASGPC